MIVVDNNVVGFADGAVGVHVAPVVGFNNIFVLLLNVRVYQIHKRYIQ